MDFEDAIFLRLGPVIPGADEARASTTTLLQAGGIGKSSETGFVILDFRFWI
jgi:hypothetical protein